MSRYQIRMYCRSRRRARPGSACRAHQPAGVLPRFFLMLFLGCQTLCPADAREPPSWNPAAGSPLNRLAMALRDMPEPLRADFAQAAISEMAMAYAEEAKRARQESRKNTRDRDLVRWSIAVDAYATELAEIANSVTPATPVDVTIGPDNSVYLFVEGIPVIISSPVSRQQAAFEQRVLESFCNLQRCDDLITEPLPPELASRFMSSETQWSFSQYAGPVCMTDDGLELQFRSMADLRQKREACDRLVAELNTLAAAIAVNIAGGTRVDWNRLALLPVAGDDRHQVVLNGEGGYIRISLPALAVTSDFLRLVRPWLAAKVNGDSYRLVIINAGLLLAPLVDK